MDDAAQIGIETTWCSDGAEALLAIGAEPPDVLVLAARIDTVDAASITGGGAQPMDHPDPDRLGPLDR